MSELVLHAVHLSEAHQLRFSYLFDIAVKRWRESQPKSADKPSIIELWVIDAQSAPEAIRQRAGTACVLLIATDEQAHALRDQWHQIDGQLSPDYSVRGLTQMLEHISLQAHGKRLRETLKTRRHPLPLAHDIQLRNADATTLKTTQTNAPAAAADPTGNCFRIKRWTQLTGSMASHPYRQTLAALISGERTLDELEERSTLERVELLRLLQVLRGKSVLIEIAPPPSTASIAIVTTAPASPAPQPGIARGLFRELRRWIGQNRGSP